MPAPGALHLPVDVRAPGVIGRLRAAVLPLVGVVMAPAVVASYVGLTVLALPVLGLQGLIRSRPL